MPRSPMPSAGQLRENAETIPGIRLVDPNVVSPHLPTVRGPASVLHAFSDTLDVDRYAVDGKTMDSVVSVRELRLSGVPAAQRNWVNDHTRLHARLRVCRGLRQPARTGEGDPVFFSGGLGSSSDAFGEYRTSRLLRRGVPGLLGGRWSRRLRAARVRLPDDSGAGGQQRTTYAGEGGSASDPSSANSRMP